MVVNSSLTIEEKSHFLRRTCFSAPNNLLTSIEAISDRAELIDWLLEQPLPDYSYPEWYLSPIDFPSLPKEERKSLRRDLTKELMAWWQGLLFKSSSPFHEQITLFWHNHFVSSIKKVKLPQAMLAQNDLFRQQGLGNFKSLLASILKDPAMLIYLDNSSSKKAAPNENLARELLELFTLGEGNYSELDVKEVARALTGASVNRRTSEFLFRERWHDNSEKTIFGETDYFSVDNLAEVIIKQPACAEFIATQFWLHFVDSAPNEFEIATIASDFVSGNFEIKALLRSLFLSDAFWNSQGKQIKSPVQLIVGTYRQFGVAGLSNQQWRGLTKNMGQLLFMPPNVKGWPGGLSWYASTAIYYRESFISKFIKWHAFEELSISLTQLLSSQPVAEITELSNVNDFAMAVSDPAYQVQ